MHAVKCHILLWSLLLVFCIPIVRAESISIEHTSFRYDRKSKIHTYTNPRVRYGNATTSARELVYDKNTEIMLFTGNVVIWMPDILLTGDTATFNRKTGRNTLQHATMYDNRNGVFIDAEKIEQVGKESYIIHKGSMTRCKQSSKAWELKGHRIYYDVNDFAYSLSTSLLFYGLPVFYSPYFSWPTKHSRSTGLLMPFFYSVNSSDESKNYGSRLRLPYFIALDRDHDVTITADIIQKRGLGLEVEYLYAFTPDMSGRFQSWSIRETFQDRDLEYESMGQLDQDQGTFDPNPLRYKYSYDHRQNILSSQIFFHQSVNSDNEINKEYFDAEIDLENQLTQTLSLIYPWTSGSLSMSYETAADFVYASTYDKTTDKDTHLNQHPTATVSQRFSRILDSPLSVNLTGTNTQYSRTEGWNGRFQEGSVEFKAPFYLDFLNIWPSVKRTWTHVDANYMVAPDEESEEDTNEDHSYGWQIDSGELELNFEIYKLFYTPEKIADKRLSIRPRIIYSAVQDIDQSEDDTTSFLDTTYGWRTLTYKLETRYLVKDLETKEVSTFFSLDLTQIYNLQMEDDHTWYSQATELETEQGYPQLPLRLSLTVTPISLFSANLFYRFDHVKQRVVETGISLSTGTAGGDQFALGYTDNETAYNEPDNTNHPAASTYTIAHTLKLNDRWTLSLAGEWDQNRSDLDFRYDGTNTVEYLDRRLTDMSATLSFQHNCYYFSVAYQEEIESKLLNDITTEYLETKLVLTLRFNVLPTSVGGSTMQATGAQYQQGFLLSD